MTEEQKQKFRELFPEYTVKDSEVCLSPFIDVFEAGIETATEESQERCCEQPYEGSPLQAFDKLRRESYALQQENER